MAAKRLIEETSGNMKDKLAARINTGKTTPAAIDPMANAYANATGLEKIENLVATFCHRKSTKTSSPYRECGSLAIWRVRPCPGPLALGRVRPCPGASAVLSRPARPRASAALSRLP
ncbi:hypothetical protein Bca101_026439 [Brassica carinata]